MPKDNKRLLVEVEKTIRETNRGVLNPAIPELTLDRLTPVLEMVAGARARFLCKLFELAEATEGAALPDPEQVRELRVLRLTYEELVAGAQALETAIHRGYLDVETRSGTVGVATG